jgi:uncharacterized protein YukE
MNPEFEKKGTRRYEVREADEDSRVKFQEACFTRLEELVADGTFPLQYAKNRQESAKLISQNLDNPEKQGVEFAEIGLEAILEFRERVDSAAQQVEDMIDDLRSRIEMIRQEIVMKGLDGYDGKKVAAIESFQKALDDEMAAFHVTVENIKNLQTGMAMMSPEALQSNIQASIEELRANGVTVELE